MVHDRHHVRREVLLIMRVVAIGVLVAVLGACVTVDQLQRESPVRTLSFAGPTAPVARCIQLRLGGKVRQEPFADTFVVYDAVKSHSTDGFTHYAITLRSLSSEESRAEGRVMRTPRHGTTTGAAPAPRFNDAVFDQYWRVVEDCAAKPTNP
jgi:hypothetical protein